MKYLETHRTVEPHAECILLLYIHDTQGHPVADVKVKIWAGPPPGGQPPYFVDDDPDNPNRLTDNSGKFQFIVANPVPSDPLDFYVQVIGADNVPQSEAVHCPFPPNEARWVIVTLVEGTSTGEGTDGGEGIARMSPTPPSAATEHGHLTNAPPGTAPSQKLFAHYLLFGPGSQPSTLTNLIIALDYILRYAPLVGFSPEEAKNAQHVTIVGDTSAVNPAVEQSLRETGCIVRRLSASDSYALEGVFKQLIDSGSPYPIR